MGTPQRYGRNTRILIDTTPQSTKSLDTKNFFDSLRDAVRKQEIANSLMSEAQYRLQRALMEDWVV